MTEVPSSPEAKKRVRSPAYPYVSLPKAIDLARKFWDIEHHHAARASRAIEHLGFSAKSGPGAQSLAALIQFGLLEDSGIKDARMVKLTPLALRILGDSDASSPARQAAIRQAAQLPKLYAELVAKYGAQSLPSERTLRDYLLFDRKFNTEVVDDALRAFRETIAFANLASSDTITTPEAEQPKGESTSDGIRGDTHMQTAGVTPKVAAPIGAAPPPPPPGATQRTFTTGTDTMDATVTITSHAGAISREDIEFLKDYLDFLGKSWSRRSKPRVTPGDPFKFGAGTDNETETES
jgi:hypothetical protein